MATTDLNLTSAGSLPRPLIIGRLVRLGFGVLCLSYIVELWGIRASPIGPSGQIPNVLWIGLALGLYLVSYVVNIGYSQSWKKRPAIVSALGLAAVAGVSNVLYGDFQSALLAWALFIWSFYIFIHLGTAFTLAAVIRTPGCEMRSFHHLWSLMTGQTTKEHVCPIGPLTPIDKWEAGRKGQ